jgi:hypothetical protein
MKADKLLFAFGCGADDDENAFRFRLHPRLQIDAVRPDVDIAASREIPALPATMLLLPGLDQTSDHARRQVRGLWAEKGRQRLLKVAHRDAFSGLITHFQP